MTLRCCYYTGDGYNTGNIAAVTTVTGIKTAWTSQRCRSRKQRRESAPIGEGDPDRIVRKCEREGVNKVKAGGVGPAACVARILPAGVSAHTCIASLVMIMYES